MARNNNGNAAYEFLFLMWEKKIIEFCHHLLLYFLILFPFNWDFNFSRLILL